MDDYNFNNPSDAKEWIQGIESERAKTREVDIYPRLRSWIGEIDAQKILDIGAGQGVCSDFIDLGSRHYTGLEPSPLLLARAKELYPHPNREFVLGNAYGMPFPDASFDAAFTVAVWHLLSDLRSAAQELRRVLKESGHFMIITANPDAYFVWTAQYSESTRSSNRFEGKIVREGEVISQDTLYLHRLDELISSLNTVGLKVTATETFRATPSGLNQFLCIRGLKPRA